MCEAGLEQIARIHNVIAEVKLGLAHGLADFCKSSEVHDSIKTAFLKRSAKKLGVGQVAFN